MSSAWRFARWASPTARPGISSKMTIRETPVNGRAGVLILGVNWSIGTTVNIFIHDVPTQITIVKSYPADLEALGVIL